MLFRRRRDSFPCRFSGTTEVPARWICWRVSAEGRCSRADGDGVRGQEPGVLAGQLFVARS